MSSFERTFVVAMPVARAWRAFTQGEERSAWGPRFEIDPVVGGAIKVDYGAAGMSPVDGQVIEVDPMRRFSWREGPGLLPGATEITVTFDEVGTGTSITISHFGFGDGDEWLGLLEAHALGWDQAIADLELYVTTGVAPQRFFTFRSDLGAVTTHSAGGLEVLRVADSGFARTAALEAGDLLVRIGRISIYSLTDVWSALRSFDPGDTAAVEVIRGETSVISEGKF